MFSFFISEFNILYSCALFFVMGLALLEGIGLVIGLSMASAFDDMFSFDIDVDATLPSGGLSGVLGWLYLSRLPVLVWLILFLTSFGIAGLSINFIVILPTLLSFPIALIIAIFSCRILGGKIATIMPTNESSAISSDSFTGKIATITVGKARKGSAAEAVLHDDFHQKHYLMVEPEVQGQEFMQGTQVILIKKLSRSWLAIEFEPS
ncbi:YqiJ family protein [Psychromonas marina]|nr:YqiJ family protein [Psychromonas marina]